MLFSQCFFMAHLTLLKTWKQWRMIITLSHTHTHTFYQFFKFKEPCSLNFKNIPPRIYHNMEGNFIFINKYYLACNKYHSTVYNQGSDQTKQQVLLLKCRPDTSRRQRRQLPPCPLMLVASVPFKCSSRSLQFVS